MERPLDPEHQRIADEARERIRRRIAEAAQHLAEKHDEITPVDGTK